MNYLSFFTQMKVSLSIDNETGTALGVTVFVIIILATIFAIIFIINNEPDNFEEIQKEREEALKEEIQKQKSNDLNEIINNLSKENEKLKQQLESSEKQIRQLNATIEKQNQAPEEYQKKITELQNEITLLTQQIAELTGQLDFQQTISQASDNSELSKENQKLKRQIKKLETHVQQLNDALKDHDAICQAYQIDIENAKRENETLQLEFFKLKIQNQSNTQNIENIFKTPEYKALQKKSKEYHDELLKTQEALHKAEERLELFTAHDDFRKRFPTPYRCNDGDWVRSKSERDIDNFFFKHRIWHIYEREYKPNRNHTFYPDFYLPDYNLYIEYFGSNDYRYHEKMDQKIEMYKHSPNLNFAYLTYEDDNRIEEKLISICEKFSIELK